MIAAIRAAAGSTTVGDSTLALCHPRRQDGTTSTFAVLIAAQGRNAQDGGTCAGRAAAVNPDQAGLRPGPRGTTAAAAHPSAVARVLFST